MALQELFPVGAKVIAIKNLYDSKSNVVPVVSRLTEGVVASHYDEFIFVIFHDDEVAVEWDEIQLCEDE